MAIDYAAIANQKKKAIQDYLANPNIDYSSAQNVLNRPSNEQGYKDILAKYSNAYNLNPKRIDALSAKYLSPALRAGKLKNQQAINQGKYGNQLANIQNQFTFPTSELESSNQELQAANQRANINRSDMSSQAFESQQNQANRVKRQQMSDIANQYGNLMTVAGNDSQSQMQSDAIKQAMLRSLIGLGGVGATGWALGAFNRPKPQPRQITQAGTGNNMGGYNPDYYDFYNDPYARVNQNKMAGQ